MSSVFCLVDDKHIPVFRVIWVADVPHFCGAKDCLGEGRYEIRLEQDESVWASREERDNLLSAVDQWSRGPEADDTWE